jgi:hypothetical protein
MLTRCRLKEIDELEYLEVDETERRYYEDECIPFPNPFTTFDDDGVVIGVPLECSFIPDAEVRDWSGECNQCGACCQAPLIPEFMHDDEGVQCKWLLNM